MRPKGDYQEVMRCLHENRSAHEAGHAPPHSVLGLGLGGGMESIRVAGECIALEDEGMSHAFTAWGAVSGAGGPIAALMCGHAARVPDVFVHLAQTQFIWWDPFRRSMRMDIKRYERILMGAEGLPGIDVERFRTHPARMFVTTTRANGTMGVVDVKTVQPHPARAIVASGAVPIATDPVDVDGELHQDGAFCGNPIPIEPGLAMLGPLPTGTRPKVLILQSRMHPKHRQLEWWTWPWWVWWQYAATLHPTLALNMMYVDTCFADAAQKLALLRSADVVRIAPAPGDVAVSPLTTHAPALIAAQDEAACFMRNLIRSTRPARQI